jgi:alpha-tubulin suppressor-like RCC1 family protein
MRTYAASKVTAARTPFVSTEQSTTEQELFPKMELFSAGDRPHAVHIGAAGGWRLDRGHNTAMSSIDCLLELPEDALADIVSRLLPDVALMRTTRFFWLGDGHAALQAGGWLACARTLGCLPGDVRRRVGAANHCVRGQHESRDGLRTAIYVLRAHAVGLGLAATNHTLIARSGVLQACGSNDHGQLGNGHVSQFSSTIYVPSPTYSSAYLARQAAVGDHVDTSLPSPVPLPDGVHAVAVAAGRDHSLMLARSTEADDASTFVYVWGSNERGQLGGGGGGGGGDGADGSGVGGSAGGVGGGGGGAAGGSSVPRPRLLDTFTSDVGDALHSLAIDGGGAFEAHPVWACLPAPRSPLNLAVMVTQVAAGATHSLFLLSSGDVCACGAGTNGELGTGELTDAVTPRRVLLPEPVRSIAAGGYHSLALAASSSRKVYGWGVAACGQLGPNADGSHELTARPSPTLMLIGTQPAQHHLDLPSHVADVSTAAATPMRWRATSASAGAASAASERDAAASGGGATDAGSAMQEGGALPRMAQLAAGLHHTLMLTQDGQAHMPGANLRRLSRSGNGGCSLLGGCGAVTLCGGADVSIWGRAPFGRCTRAARARRVLWAYRRRDATPRVLRTASEQRMFSEPPAFESLWRQVGIRRDVRCPTLVKGVHARVCSLAAGGAHSAFVTAEGDLYACGSTAHGRLGISPTRHEPGGAAHGEPLKNVLVPMRVPLPAGRRAIRVVAGYDHMVVQLVGGTTFVCGRGQTGQLGCGDRKDQTKLRHVPTLDAAACVRIAAAGGAPACAAAAETYDVPPVGSTLLPDDTAGSLSSSACRPSVAAAPDRMIGGAVMNRFR